jgi:hypothetical protein
MGAEPGEWKGTVPPHGITIRAQSPMSIPTSAQRGRQLPKRLRPDMVGEWRQLRIPCGRWFATKATSQLVRCVEYHVGIAGTLSWRRLDGGISSNAAEGEETALQTKLNITELLSRNKIGTFESIY